MKTRDSLFALVAELEGDFRDFHRVMALNARAQERIRSGADDPLDWGALGFTLHSAYGVLENYFLRISKFFENELPPERWHRALVEKMSLEIPGVRPALLTGASCKTQALELQKFRHRFRNLYGEDLDPQKTSSVQRNAEGFAVSFPALHEEFCAKLRAIAEEMG